MTLSYKVRVLALLLSLVHSSYGALFARPPPQANYCKPGTCAVFHSPINRSHTICTRVPIGTNVTNHVDNVNPDKICPSQGRGGFPDDIHGKWGGDVKRDSFCTALEVFKTNISHLNGIPIKGINDLKFIRSLESLKRVKEPFKVLSKDKELIDLDINNL